MCLCVCVFVCVCMRAWVEGFNFMMNRDAHDDPPLEYARIRITPTPTLPQALNRPFDII